MLSSGSLPLLKDFLLEGPSSLTPTLTVDSIYFADCEASKKKSRIASAPLSALIHQAYFWSVNAPFFDSSIVQYVDLNVMSNVALSPPSYVREIGPTFVTRTL